MFASAASVNHPWFSSSLTSLWSGIRLAQTIFQPEMTRIRTAIPERGVFRPRRGGLGPDNSDLSDDEPEYHRSVLLAEVVEALRPASGRRLIDGTLGGGGHTFELLKRGAEVVGFDRDPEAIEAAKARCAEFDERFVAIRMNFSNLAEVLSETRAGKVDGVLLDLGVSSHQLDEPERGFSFQSDGPLDMRMNPNAPRSAADVVNQSDEAELRQIFFEYGEERAASRIARAIVAARERNTILTTSQLAAVVERVKHRTGRNHPATKIFQALRIEVNAELDSLRRGLEAAVASLKPGGRLAVISFHSLEDRIVKNFMRDRSQQLRDRPEWPAPRPNPNFSLKLVQRKPITPTKEEVKSNPRSRSSKLRVAERI